MANGISRIDLYLRENDKELTYRNTPEEEELVVKFQELYSQALSAKESNELANPTNIKKWRQAYLGTLSTLNKRGEPSMKQGRQCRKVIYEFVESKVDNTIPLPKMIVRHKADLPVTQVTEDYIKHTIASVYTKHINDRSERATMTDGTSWYKVSWDNTASTYENSGNVRIDVCLSDQIIPQPGIINYKDMEYIFELEQVSVSKIYDVYGRLVDVSASNTSQPARETSDVDRSTVTVINCYYKNDQGIIGRFSWTKNSLQVICNDECWQIRKLRKCKRCGTILPVQPECPLCGSTSFVYESAETEILKEDLMEIYNPYDADETTEEENKDEYKERVFLQKGTEIPYYQIRQLPFVPRVNISSIDCIYGISEPFMLVEIQDCINKLYTKIVDKTYDSSAILIKPKRVKVDTDTDGVKLVNVNTYDEAESVRTIQVAADTQQDVMAAQMLYESAKALTGITEAYQGKYDSSAQSGKAKEFSASQSAGRLESYKTMKSAAFAGVYELVLKFLLAFSDEDRKFMKKLPNGDTEEETWSKYSFLAKTDEGIIYYRDDFQFDTDPAATLSSNRVAMWQEIQAQFTQGTMGDTTDDRTRELFWNILSEQQYPLADYVLAGIKDNSQHLPPQIEQLLLQNPEVLQQVLQQFQDAGLMPDAGGTQSGGARVGAGRPGNGLSHAANVEANNQRNRNASVTPEERVEASNTSEGQVQ